MANMDQLIYFVQARYNLWVHHKKNSSYKKETLPVRRLVNLMVKTHSKSNPLKSYSSWWFQFNVFEGVQKQFLKHQQNTKCWRNSVGQEAAVEEMDKRHFGLGSFFSLIEINKLLYLIHQIVNFNGSNFVFSTNYCKINLTCNHYIILNTINFNSL